MNKNRNTAEYFSMLFLFMPILTTEDSEFLESTIYDFVTSHKSVKCVSLVRWQSSPCDGRAFSTAVPRVGQVVLMAWQTTV